MEVLDLRTFRDLQYVRDTENLMKTVDGKLKTASENPRSLNPKSFQVPFFSQCLHSQPQCLVQILISDIKICCKLSRKRKT